MRFLKQLPAVTRAVYDEMAPELRGLAFTLTGMEDARQIQAVRNIIAQLPEGMNFEDVKDQIMAALPWGGARAERRAELLLRHWGAIAYAQAQYKHDERQKDVFPWRQYITMGDGKVRDTHRALNGIILPVDSPFWKGHLPPWDWMCRCQSVVLMDMDVEEIRQADRHLPPEERRVIEGALLEKLEKSQTLIRGNGRAFDVRTPAEKGESFRGWSPDNILQGVDFTGLTTELDPPVLGKLKTFWEENTVDGKRTVADWIKGHLKGPAAATPEAAAGKGSSDASSAPAKTPAFDKPPTSDDNEPHESDPRPDRRPGGSDAPGALERAAADLRASLRPDGRAEESPAGDGDFSRMEREWERLRAWAKESGLILPEDHAGAEKEGGGEHDVRFDPATGRWWKYTKPHSAGFAVSWEGTAAPFIHNASPLEYLERLQAQNALFGDGLRLEGLWRDPETKAWRLVTTQPNVPGTRLSRAEIIDGLAVQGWELQPQWAGLGYRNSLTFRRGDWLMTDVHPANLVRSPAGLIIPFDVILTRLQNPDA